MNMIYRTQRLILKILSDIEADQVLQFYLDNQEVFEIYETDRPKYFYTKQFQKTLLNCEYNMIIKQSAIRFWIYEKNQMDKIIGTVSFQNIKRSFYQSCEIGYKFDQRFWRKGYAKESVSKGIQIAFEDLGLHRIEAYVLPENISSIKLLESMGFQLEGIKKQNVKLHGVWKDHEMYALLSSDYSSK